MEEVIVENVNHDNNNSMHSNSEDTKDEFLPEEQEDSIFQNDITLVRIKCCCMVYFIVGLFFVFTIISYKVSSFSTVETNAEINKGTYTILLIILDSMIIINILILIYNKYISYKYRGFLYEIPIENIKVLYFMVIPLTTASVVFFVLASIANFKNDENFLEKVTPFIEIIFYTAAVMLLIDFGGILHTGEHYQLKVVTTWALFTTLVGVFNNCLFHFTFFQLTFFMKVTSRFFNVTYHLYNSTDELSFISYIWERFTVGWGIVVFCYLLAPVKRNLMEIETTTEIYVRSLDRGPNEEITEVENSQDRQISTTSLVIGIFIVTMGLLNIPLRVIDEGMKPDSVMLKITKVFYIALNIVGVFFHVFLLKAMQSWTYVERSSIVDKTLMWIGFFGEFISILIKFINTFDDADLNAFVIIDNCILFSLRMTILILVILVVEISFSRRPKLEDFHGSMKTFNPLVVLLCFHITGAVIVPLTMGNKVFVAANRMSLALLELHMWSISEICISIYGLYITLYLGTMLRSVYS